MNGKIIDRLKKWGSLAVIFIVIVCISGALPNYLTPPKAQPQQTANKNSSKTLVPAAPQTGALAIVNEDQGADVNGQRLNLGNQIVPLFSSGDDYNWETVSRSAADTGLKQGTYQAAIYIPSNFTSNIFTYTNSQPKAAVISYSANPKLTAEDAAKVQTEMQKVKGTLNQQFSKIYWRVISDKLSYIRGNFADVVNKDKQYLQAMSDFYKPSSQNMAQVFGAQLDQINTLLAETKQSSSDVASQQTTLTDTKNQVSQQLDALNKLSDQLNQQIQSLQKTRDANKQLVDDASSTAQNSLTNLLDQYQNSVTGLTDTANSSKELSLTPELDQLSSFYTGGTSLISGIPNSDQNNEDQITAIFTGAQTYTQNIYKQIALDTYHQIVNGLAKQNLTDGANNLEKSQNGLKQLPAGSTGGGSSSGDSTSTGSGSSSSDSTSTGSGSSSSDSTSTGSGSSSGDSTSTGDGSSSGESTSTGSSSSSDSTGGGTGHQSGDPAAYDDIVSAITSLQTEITSDDDYKSIDGFNYINSIITTVNNNLSEGTIYTADSLLNYYKALSIVENDLNTYATLTASDMEKSFDQNTDAINSNTNDTVKKNVADLNTEQINAQDLGRKLDDNAKKINSTVPELNAKFEQLNGKTDSINGSINSKDNLIQNFYKITQQQKSDLVTAENVLANNMAGSQQQVAAIAKPLVLTAPDPTFASVDNGFALSFKSNTFDQLNTIDQGLQNISDNESAILKDSQNVQSLVNGVQSGANQLTGSWGQNLNATAGLGSTISQTLGNTGEPGNRNQGAYQQLASPVNLAGLQLGNPNNAAQNQDQNAASTDTTPAAPVTQPFLTLLAVLIASILTGYFSYHYRNLSRTANALISAALALITSGVIIAYGVAQYGLEGGAVIMWSLFTIGLIALISAWVREAYQLSEIVGVLLIAALVVYFTLPLLKNSMDRFAYQNPASDVYLAIAYGPDYAPFLKGIVAVLLLVIPVLAVIGIRAMIRHVREEKANETETF